MKISLARRRGRPLDQSDATNCLVLNLLATPGLGSWVAGRTLAAIPQLTLAVIGFILIIGWFGQLFVQMFRAMINGYETEPWFPRIGKIGAAFFIAAWIWSLYTSLSVRSEARRNGAMAKSAPPVISD